MKLLRQVRKTLHGVVMMKLPHEVPVATITPFGLRMQPDLKRRIEEAAQRSGRSMNSEIIARLEWSLSQSELRSDATPTTEDPMFELLEKRMRHLEETIATLLRDDRSSEHDMRLQQLEHRIGQM